MQNNYKKLLTPQGGTWREGIETYHNFFKADLTQYIDDLVDYYELPKGSTFILHDIAEEGDEDDFLEPSMYNLYKQRDKSSTAYINRLENEFGEQIPKELQDLYLNFGTFGIDGCEGFDISSLVERDFFYSEFSNYAYTSMFSEETDTLSKEQLDELLKRFYFFGVGFFESGARSVIYYYDREEKYYGEAEMLPDECPKMKSEIFPAMFSATLPRYTLDELICRQVDRYLLKEILFHADINLAYSSGDDWEVVLNERYKE